MHNGIGSDVMSGLADKLESSKKLCLNQALFMDEKKDAALVLGMDDLAKNYEVMAHTMRLVSCNIDSVIMDEVSK